MWPIFSGRNAKLETMNRILTDAARKRTERIEELETQVTQLERQVVELEPARKRTRELEVVAAQRADRRAKCDLGYLASAWSSTP